MKKTKLVYTISQYENDEDIIRKLILSGINVIGINLLFSNYELCESVVKKVRKINKELNTNVGILFETKGSNIMIRTFSDRGILLNLNDIITLTPDKNNIGENRFNISFKKLSFDLDIDTIILLDYGKIKLKVVEINNADIKCVVLKGGLLFDNRILTVPNEKISIDYLSVDEKKDIMFASKLKVDFIALSCLRNANDILDVNDILIGEKNEFTEIIAKIENSNALDDIDNIIKVCDGIIVCRDELSSQVLYGQMPIIQKEIVKKAKEKNKKCIITYNKLLNNYNNDFISNLNIYDISNSIIDGIDAIFLKNCISDDNNVLETIDYIVKVICETENKLDYNKMLLDMYDEKIYDSTSILAYSSVEISNLLKAKAIFVSSTSGYTSRKISHFRPMCPIVVVTPYKEVATSLSLNWGVVSIVEPKFDSLDFVVDIAKRQTKKMLNLHDEEVIVVTGSLSNKKSRGSNFLKIEKI